MLDVGGTQLWRWGGGGGAPIGGNATSGLDAGGTQLWRWGGGGGAPPIVAPFREPYNLPVSGRLSPDARGGRWP